MTQPIPLTRMTMDEPDQRRILLNEIDAGHFYGGNTEGRGLTQADDARRLVLAHGRSFLWVPEEKQFRIWNGSFWGVDRAGHVRQYAEEAARRLITDAAAITDSTLRDAQLRHSSKALSRSGLDAAIELSKSIPGVAVPKRYLDADPWLLNVADGTLDLRTGELLPHDAANLITRWCPVDYAGEAACPRWDAFLDKVTCGRATLVAFLQRLAGYWLTGDTAEQIIVLFHGGGQNGKSTYLESIRELLGDYSAHTRADTLMVKRAGGASNDIARLDGIRLADSVEVNQDQRLDEALVKSLTGGDRVTARFLFGEYFEFRPTAKWVIATNHRPRIGGVDEGIWRRVVLVPWDYHVPEAERDLALRAKLSAELTGILRWAVEGCLAWQRDGLGRPEEVRQATAGYRSEMDSVSKFLREACRETPGAMVAASLLNAAYSDWCEQTGEAKVGRGFPQRVAERFPRKKFPAGFYYLGLALPDSGDARAAPFAVQNHNLPQESRTRGELCKCSAGAAVLQLPGGGGPRGGTHTPMPTVAMAPGVAS